MCKTCNRVCLIVMFIAIGNLAVATEGVWKLNRMGDEIWVIQDADSTMDIAIFKGPLTDEQRREFMPGGKAPASVNVFLIKQKERTILIDAGWGASGRVKGKALERLAAEGVTPEKVDYVFLTHMHADHISGLLDADGKAVFPRAKVMVCNTESDYWLTAPASAGTPGRNLGEAVRKAYGERFQTFAAGKFVVSDSGIIALEAKGHTPGHIAFMVIGGGRPVLIAGDILHAAALQFPNPDECATYDMDAEDAIATRKNRLHFAAEDGRTILAGSHIPFPGMGTVKENGKGGYIFTPLEENPPQKSDDIGEDERRKSRSRQ